MLAITVFCGYELIPSYGGVRDATFISVYFIANPFGVLETSATVPDLNSLCFGKDE